MQWWRWSFSHGHRKFKLKKIFLIRHAKSDWTANLSDYNRPLNKRGCKDAPIMGKRMLQLYNKPNFIVSSGAKRALHTPNYLRNHVTTTLMKFLLMMICTMHQTTIINIIKSLPDIYNNVCIFSHNPGISEAVTKLTEHYIFLKTCCVGIVEDKTEYWARINEGNCKLIGHLTPKDNLN